MCIPSREKEAAIVASDIKDWISYNPKTGEFKWIKSRGTIKAGSVTGATSPEGYIIIGFNGARLRAHRLAWFYTYGVFPSGVIDHIDNNKANNRIRNLRDVSHAENSQNRANSAHWLGGYVSASKNKCKSRNIDRRKGRYQVRVTLNKNQLVFGSWSTLEEALAVRDEMLEHGWSREYFEQKYPHKAYKPIVNKRKDACGND